MSDKPSITVTTEECIYEEHNDTNCVLSDDHPTMKLWRRSLRSLFHLQASPDASATPSPECIRQACYEAGEINSCECDFCLPPTQDKEEEE